MKTIPIILAVAMIAASPLCGESALDGFDPNANGTVYVAVVQPDGKIIIGGDFTTLAPNGGGSVTRNHIARLNPDGTLDTAFNPDANDTVYAIAVQADGKILAGGSFSSIGGLARTNIARLDATNGQADSWNPNANSTVASIVVQAGGKVIAGGSFSIIGGQTRTNIARLDAATGLADSFNPNANGVVLSIAVQADGKVIAGGSFSIIGGLARTNIARLDAVTGLADSFNPNANGFVLSIAVQADGKVIAGGDFNGASSIGGATRNRIARLDPVTGLADSFNPNANNFVRAITVQADGKILVGGDFTGANSIGGATRHAIARLNSTGLADSFNPNPESNAEVFAIAVQADGKILVGGRFTTLTPNGGGGLPRNYIARLETDGRLDHTLILTLIAYDFSSPFVSATAIQPDGKILVGGSFTVNFADPNNIARLNTDGTLDLGFNPDANAAVYAIEVQADGKILVGGSFNGANSIGGQFRDRIARLDAVTGLPDSFAPQVHGAGAFTGVYSIAVQADGKILVGGNFSGANSVGGQTRNRIARLDAATGAVDSFDPNANGPVNAIEVQADGKILIGGGFTVLTPNGGAAVTRNYIARLNADGSLDAAFDPNANGGVSSIAVQPDGKILVGGVFNGTNSIGGATRNRIARLDAATGLADSFDPNANGGVQSIVLQADGKILVGGSFNGANSIGGQTRNRIARLDPATGAADSFDPNATGGTVAGLTVQADGKIIAGGDFANIGGQTGGLLARLNNDTAALQNLAVTQTTITWTLGGSSPQPTRVTFESSTNTVDFTPLGNGTPSGSNWTLTGLSLLTGKNLYIRARGFYNTGGNNGSQSIMESVRNAFLVARPILNIQRSANTNVVLSWATNFTGFTLESNTNLNTNVWSTVSPAPAVSGTNNVVTNATTEAQKFYRLFKP